jgi:hypothetical protein
MHTICISFSFGFVNGQTTIVAEESFILVNLCADIFRDVAITRDGKSLVPILPGSA